MRPDAIRYAIGARHGVYILSATLASQHVPSPRSTLIRIGGSGSEDKHLPLPHAILHLYEEILEVYFSDLDVGDKTLSDVDASRIAEAIKRHMKVKAEEVGATLVVHCQAGISRSAGVACAFASWLGDSDMEEDIRYSGVTVPNSLVYRKVLDALNAESHASNDTTIYFDVDDTLIMYDTCDSVCPKCVEVPMLYKDMPTWVHRHEEHLELLMKHKKLGHTIVVWSNQGASWARRVVDILGIAPHVDYCLSKPHKYVDDIGDPRTFMGERVYLGLENQTG
jgi:predicted protein tyrosine phosphatase